ncbi:pyruvate carboxylase [Chloropicon primus]|uniref:pyruvate carboxylase n=1 Tax=Chloropicon primus TaxID=1764295 RepID=A0A5B8MQI4_9CHLO|nr:pyruvate carboxylase [Chloropicon primus]UPR01490.1 pyruvate carboxylase [Chloropicon primus]|mmetsp:Transcript_4567/g.13595  ORF Transcript_4567/g.13595 Transcript_4567/m.13595 type:complete len:1246 (-) Transcript_4567:105-3842(-)|eukprot:QDZ22274.1 pyruvate carboxylase [Chloropicon primus]
MKGHNKAKAASSRGQGLKSCRGVGSHGGSRRQPAAVVQRGQLPVARSCGGVRGGVVARAVGEVPADQHVDSSSSSSSSLADLAPPSQGIKKLMCANRGEIATRVFRAAHELGIRSVAIFSFEDRLQVHRYKADESYVLKCGEKELSPVGAYLDIDTVIRIAKENDVDAIHPGYGFLSENTAFAKRCEEEGIIFIGPSAENLQRFGDKTQARELAIECGIPVIPGLQEESLDVDAAYNYAEEIGFPVMIKAAMGGGGRGMRVVRSGAEFKPAYERASNEALQAFGDGRMFVEKYIENPRHIEIQILADKYGNTVHLYERDCSVQRRHQKIIEVAPSVGIKESTRQAMYADAKKIASHVGYVNAGTVEFMLAPDGSHYFLEVNPRVQVEHTITEEITGIDIVQSQILIATGSSLTDIGIPNQEGVRCDGFAIQGRVTSENPEDDFRPDSGRIEAYRTPGGPGIRLDGAIASGGSQLPYYDSLLVKCIAHAHTFQGAAKKLENALHEFRLRGVRTNVPFITNVLKHPKFLSGTADTSLIESTPELFDFPLLPTDLPSKLLRYLAHTAVNGAKHPGAVGEYPKGLPDPVIPKVPQEFRGQAGKKGWRPLLLEKGPEEFAKSIRGHKGLLLTDTTMRDAHQSLLATRVRTYDILGAADYSAWALEDCMSLEVWGGATFDVSMRFLHECPWDRLKELRKRIPNVPFQMLLRGVNAVGYTSYPDNLVKEFVKKANECGVDIFRVFDSLNYIDNLKFGIEAVLETNGVAEGTICYTADLTDPSRPKYDLDYYLNLARELVDAGVHILGIKDMAGLLKPASANMLVSALRKEFPDIPIHVHTHDTPGMGVASMIAAAEAGADVVDCCVDSMSGLTSQPSMGSLLNAFKGTDLDTGLDPSRVLRLSTYWEQVRAQYGQFESGMKSGSSEVYEHEMPGGQYTNLKFQAMQNGLVEQWEEVKEAYRMGNYILGDIVKVTPSSKVVGDLAQFIVQNNLTESTIVDVADKLDFPKSVVEYFQGYLGQPPGGFPEELREKVLKGKPTVSGRPGSEMEDFNFALEEGKIVDKYGKEAMSELNVISRALYPSVFDDFYETRKKYSDVSILPTKAFLRPLETDEMILLELGKGMKAEIVFKAVGDRQASGTREVFFELNGLPRVIEVVEETVAIGDTLSMAKEKANPSDEGSVGAPMAGQVIDVNCKPGEQIKAGDPMVVLSAMKMETTVSCPIDGTVAHVAVQSKDNVSIGDLLVMVEPEEQ